MTIAEGIERALVRASIPTISVRIGDEADRATWEIQFHPTATPEQEAAGLLILEEYDPETDTSGLSEAAGAYFVGITMESLIDYLAEWRGHTSAHVRNDLIAIATVKIEE